MDLETLGEPVNGENQLLVMEDPIESEKQLVEVQDFKKVTNHSRNEIEYIPQIKEQKLKDVNM